MAQFMTSCTCEPVGRIGNDQHCDFRICLNAQIGLCERQSRRYCGVSGAGGAARPRGSSGRGGEIWSGVSYLPLLQD